MAPKTSHFSENSFLKRSETEQRQGNAFPRIRMRRNRTDGWLRDMLAENRLSVQDLVWPVFVIEGKKTAQPVCAMPGVERLTIDLLLEQAMYAADQGIPAIAVFPVIDRSLRNAQGSEAVNPDNLICRAIQALKNKIPHIGIIADVALDPFTDHGHDGLLEDGKIVNDATLQVLCQQALIQAQAGVDIIAPSDMMDGRIGSIRDALDMHGLENTKIMSYAAKYASSFYGPFRDAVESGGLLKGDKATYQMNPANSDEALKEVALDLAEGADMIMVKPGMPYLDVIRQIKDKFAVPTAAYNVSGEYAMLKAAAQNGWLNYDHAMIEMLLAFKRAGADMILSYAALDAAKKLK